MWQCQLFTACPTVIPAAKPARVQIPFKKQKALTDVSAFPGGDVAEQHSRFAADICQRQIECVQTPSKSSRRGSGFVSFAYGKSYLAFAITQALACYKQSNGLFA